MSNSVCKYCGEKIKWAQEGGRWIPLDPELGVSHQSTCVAKGSGVKLSPVKSVGQRVGEDVRMRALESRVQALEEKLGIMTYRPFKNVK